MKPSNEYGKSSAYYIYDIESATVHALLQLIQDSAFKEPPSSYSDAAASYQQELDFLKDRAEPLDNLGDKAFFSPNINQVGVLYKDCFIMVAFKAVQEEQNAEVVKAVAKKIIENMK